MTWKYKLKKPFPPKLLWFDVLLQRWSNCMVPVVIMKKRFMDIFETESGHVDQTGLNL